MFVAPAACQSLAIQLYLYSVAAYRRPLAGEKPARRLYRNKAGFLILLLAGGLKNKNILFLY